MNWRHKLLSAMRRYLSWLHTGWPSGSVEPLPELGPGGETAIPGLYVAGDLAGLPLLKFALDGGTAVVQSLAKDESFLRDQGQEGVVDLAIVGGGVAGMAAAAEAKRLGIAAQVFEARDSFSTLRDFPRGKPIFLYPRRFEPRGPLQVEAEVKEDLVRELEAQVRDLGVMTRTMRVHSVHNEGRLLRLIPSEKGEEGVLALRVLVAIGRSGDFRRLGVPGEDGPQVMHRLHDPRVHRGQEVVVVGGGDSAVEAAVALRAAGARVLLSYRGEALSRPKPSNRARIEQILKEPDLNLGLAEPSSGRVTTAITQQMIAVHEEPGSLELSLRSEVLSISERSVCLCQNGRSPEDRPADAVFVMIGREAPLDFFRRSGVPIQGEWTPRRTMACLAFLLFCAFVYNWKAGGALGEIFEARGWFPFGVPEALLSFGDSWGRPASLLGTLRLSLGQPGFFYSLAYTLVVLVFGLRRIKRRSTPYVTVQTLCLMAIQAVPLFLLPYLIFPWMGHIGLFDQGWGQSFADALFPAVDYDPHGREYWRSFGFLLAWPLFLWNVFTEEPLGAWLVIGFVQTFVLIPALVWRYGKGAYCGWICSCGALAETLGDSHRRKMPHGAVWNRLNGAGQGILALALFLLVLRVTTWVAPNLPGAQVVKGLYYGLLSGFSLGGIQLNYYWLVDLGLAGVLGVGLYFWASGRVWCRFFCPLAALMHIYARFSQFRIFAEKSRCISCNQCTAVCHQGIDVMSFANKGLPMQDPQCVRCSACVQTCPTGVLQFGRIGSDGSPVADQLAASRLQILQSVEGGVVENQP